MGEMIFNGVSTSELGVVIQTPPTYEFPEKDYDVVHIPGRSGDILIEKGSYQNTRRTYYLALSLMNQENKDFIFNASKIVSWLNSAKGYARLEDSYEPLYFRSALFRNSGNLTNLFDKATAIAVSFECKPQRYLKTGEIEIFIDTVGSWILIENPTDQIATPEITFNGDNPIFNFVSGEDPDNPDSATTVTCETSVEGIIDSELQEVYNDNGYLNSSIEVSNGLPRLYPGKNWIKLNTAASTISIKPRWWIL